MLTPVTMHPHIPTDTRTHRAHTRTNTLRFHLEHALAQHTHTQRRTSHLEHALAPDADNVRVQVEGRAVGPVLQLRLDPIQLQCYVYWLYLCFASVSAVSASVSVSLIPAGPDLRWIDQWMEAGID